MVAAWCAAGRAVVGHYEEDASDPGHVCDLVNAVVLPGLEVLAVGRGHVSARSFVARAGVESLGVAVAAACAAAVVCGVENYQGVLGGAALRALESGLAAGASTGAMTAAGACGSVADPRLGASRTVLKAADGA